MSRRPRWRGIARTLLGSALLTLIVAGPAPRALGALPLLPPHDAGELVRIQGRVTDASGQPLAGVTVLLEVSRSRFRFRQMANEVSDTLTVPTTTGAQGEFSFDWRWDPYYNTFWLALALPTGTGSAAGSRGAHEIFHRADVTPAVESGNPADVPITVADTGYVTWLRRFLDGSASADEKRVLSEMGRPEKIDEIEAGRAREASWWYFRAGRVYHFDGGRLEQVAHFPPITPPAVD